MDFGRLGNSRGSRGRHKGIKSRFLWMLAWKRFIERLNKKSYGMENICFQDIKIGVFLYFF